MEAAQRAAAAGCVICGVVSQVLSARVQRARNAQPAAARAWMASCRDGLERIAAPAAARTELSKTLGVGVQRAPEDVVDRTGLDDAPGIHDADLVGQRAHTARSCVIQINAAPVSFASFFNLVQDLALDGDVERRGRLIGDDQLGR